MSDPLDTTILTAGVVEVDADNESHLRCFLYVFNDATGAWDRARKVDVDAAFLAGQVGVIRADAGWAKDDEGADV